MAKAFCGSAAVQVRKAGNFNSVILGSGELSASEVSNKVELSVMAKAIVAGSTFRMRLKCKTWTAAAKRDRPGEDGGHGVPAFFGDL